MRAVESEEWGIGSKTGAGSASLKCGCAPVIVNGCLRGFSEGRRSGAESIAETLRAPPYTQSDFCD